MAHKSGQITVFILLLALMGLTIGLSQASRSLSDLKQVSYVDSGIRAYAGAESGLQYALSQFDPGVDYSSCVPGTQTTDLPSGIARVDYQTCGGSNDSFTTTLLKDSVLTVDLSAKSFPSSTDWRVFWNDPALIEIIIVRSDNTVYRYAFNGLNNLQSNGFSLSKAGNDASCEDPSPTFNNCVSLASASSPKDTIIRIKALTSDTPVKFWAKKPGNSQPILVTQTYTFTVTATTNDGTKKKLQVTKIPPALPSIFDFALYANNGIVKN